MPRTRTCQDCGGQMELVGQRRHIFEPDPETMTEGQFAEQVAAEMGGAFEEGIHGNTVTVYGCTECDKWHEVG